MTLDEMGITEQENNHLNQIMDTKLSEDSPEYKNLEDFARYCAKEAPACAFEVKHICRCLDLERFWTTIVVKRKDSESSFQMLNPNQWKMVVSSKASNELQSIAKTIIHGRYASLYA